MTQETPTHPKNPIRLTSFDTRQSMEVVWDALAGYRDTCIPESNPDYDEEWDDICTAMAWIADALDIDQSQDTAPPPGQPEKIPHSVIIAWDDNDIPVQGTFAWSGLAYDEDDAEIEARTAMMNQLIEELGLEGDDALEKAEELGDPAHFGGSVVETVAGVNIWAAPDLVIASKAILDWGRQHTSPRDPNSPHHLLVMLAGAIAITECRRSAP